MPKVLVMNKGFVFVRLLVPLMAAFSSSALGVDALDNWQWRNPRTGTAISAATYGAGRFVLAGEAGAILTSEDVSNWVTYNSGITNAGRALVYGGNQFVLVGDSGSIAYSSDGTTWITAASGTLNHLSGITYGNGVFVAVGNAGTILTSSNGQSWVTQNSGIAGNFTGIAYGNGMFVATTDSSYRSTNGISWEQVALPGVALTGVVFGKGIFVASGFREFNRFGPIYFPYVYTSSNGASWAEQAVPSMGSGGAKVITVGEHFITYVGGVPSIVTSEDGTNWIRTLQGVAQAGAYGAGRYVILGTALTPPYGPHTNNTLITSTDATNWTVAAPPIPTLNDVAYGNGAYVAAGSFYSVADGSFTGKALVSTNGRDFDVLTLSAPISRLLFAKGSFLAVGNGGTLLRSINGRDWTRRSANTQQHLIGIAIGDETLVAVGNAGTIITSPDGLVWARRFSPTDNHLYGITWGNNRFVAVGSSGTIITSPNGADWSVEYTDSFEKFVNIAYGNGLFVAVGEAGAVLTSPDGSVWTPRTTGISPANFFTVSYGNGNFIITGPNLVLTSTNGIAWTRRNPGTHAGLYGAAFLNGSFWMVGDAGTILESVQIPSITLLARSTPEGVELTCSGGESGRVYELQSCTNALGNQWRHLHTFTNSQTAYRFVDPVEHASSFYRITGP